MHSHRRHRGKILFEVLCASLLGASLVGAWDQTKASALLASAAVVALFALYWCFGLFGRREAVQVVRAAAEPPPVQAAPAVQLARIAAPVQVANVEPEAPVLDEVFTPEPQLLPEPEPKPEPVAAAPAKRSARKPRKAKPVSEPVAEQPEIVAIEEPVAEQPEPVAVAEPVAERPEPVAMTEPPASGPIEPFFNPQPLIRQQRPAFGRKPQSPSSLSA